MKSPRCAGRTEGQRDEDLMVGAFQRFDGGGISKQHFVAIENVVSN
jgi:hypothetical protein